MRRFVSIYRQREDKMRRANADMIRQRPWWYLGNWNWTAIGTCIMALFTLGIYSVGRNQWKTFQSQLDVMTDQLNEMKSENRPWVSTDMPIITDNLSYDVNGARIGLKFTLRNTGRSPANRVGFNIKAFASPLSFNYNSEMKNACTAAFGFSRLTLFPGGSLTVPIETDISNDELKETKTKLHGMLDPIVIMCIAYSWGGQQIPHFTGLVYDVHMRVPAKPNRGCCLIFMKDGDIDLSDLVIEIFPAYPGVVS